MTFCLQAGSFVSGLTGGAGRGGGKGDICFLKNIQTYMFMCDLFLDLRFIMHVSSLFNLHISLILIHNSWASSFSISRTCSVLNNSRVVVTFEICV